MADRDALLKPLEFRFTEPQDVETYGDQWITYDELDIVTKDARTLMAWEAEIGASLSSVMNGVRESSVFGDTCAAWVALKLAGRDIRFAEFSPATMLLVWRRKPVEEGKDPGSPAPTPPDGEPASGPLAIVALGTMPAAESPTS